jgi:ABC-type dipeptide/oligopeptide/nickel transport system permease component
MQGTVSYLMRQMLWVPVILVIVSAFTFTIARLGPGDPIRIAAGQFRDPEAFQRVKEARGLDKPIYEQYGIYMKNVLTKGDLGISYRYKDFSVSEIIFPAMWHSMQYNVVALFLTILVGIPAGIACARLQGTWVDPMIISVLLFLSSLLALVIVPFMLLYGALKTGLVPASGWPRDCRVELPFLGDAYKCIGVISPEAIIPILALSIGSFAFWARFTRAFTLDVLKEDYVRTARSKGLPEVTILRRHVLRNALLPLSTMLAFSLVGLIEGAFFVETLTGIPGIGRLSFESINGRDYDMIMAVTLVGTTAFVIVSISVDIVYKLIDPRIRYGSRSR